MWINVRVGVILCDPSLTCANLRALAMTTTQIAIIKRYTDALFTPQSYSITTLWPVLFSDPLRVGGSVGLVGWLLTEVVCLSKMVTPLGTKRVRHRVTSLIRPTSRLLRHAATPAVHTERA